MHNEIEATRSCRLVPENVVDFSGPGQRNLTLNINPSDYPDIHISKTGTKVLDTYVNLKWLLSKFSAAISYNLMKREPEIIFPGMYIPIENQANYILGLVDRIAILNHMPTQKLVHHLDMIALENVYHPIVKCIKDKTWDSVSRVKEFIATLETDNPKFTYQIVLTWMVAAVAAAFSEDGFINQGVLVIQGKQGIGKSTFVKKLEPINCSAIKEGVFLDPTNKDSISQIASYWVVELGELDSIFSKSAIGRIKSYITMEYDFLRTPYARKPIKLARRTAYVATVNENNFLIDDTGNRRWWCISVNKINEHNLDMQQVWAEVYYLWASGHLTHLDQNFQNQINEENKTHERIDPIEEKILNFYNWDDSYRRELTATEILEEIGYHNPDQSMARRMGVSLIKINGVGCRRSHGKNLHQIPRPKIIHDNYLSV